jgi:Domain of unknown function (DUF6089)
MRKLITTLFVGSLLFVNSTITKAQYVEIGATVGGTSYVGDLQKFKPAVGSFGPTASLVARWNRSPRLALRATAMYGSFNATDAREFGDYRLRNLETKTALYELAVCAEYNIMSFDIIDGKTNAPYVFLGVGGLYFNPQARYQDKWIDLRPLGTEGQFLEGGKPYSPFQVVVPMGFGIKLALWQRLSVGFEFGVRQTFTDYLDDVSGKYPNLDALSKINPIASDMSYRAVSPTQRANVTGLKRGDGYRTDRYYTAGVSMMYSLAGARKMEYNTSYRNFFNL